MLSTRYREAAAGVSLIESMLALAVSAIVLVNGVPSLGRWVRDLEVRNSASSVHAALQAARAEAVSRNTLVRLELGDAQGHTGWRLSCVRISAQCPATIRQQPAGDANGVRWAASSLSDTPALGTPLAVGVGMPASISFDALGTAPGIASGTEVARVDVFHKDSVAEGRLVVQVSALGIARICNPAAASGHSEECR